MSFRLGKELQIAALAVFVGCFAGQAWADSARKMLIPELSFGIVCLEPMDETEWQLISRSKQFSLFGPKGKSLPIGETEDTPSVYRVTPALSPCFYEFEAVQRPVFDVASGITAPPNFIEIEGSRYTVEIGSRNLFGAVRYLTAICNKDVKYWASSQQSLTHQLPYTVVPIGTAEKDYCPGRVNHIIFSHSTRLQIHFEKNAPELREDVVFVLNDVYYDGRKITEW